MTKGSTPTTKKTQFECKSFISSQITFSFHYFGDLVRENRPVMFLEASYMLFGGLLCINLSCACVNFSVCLEACHAL